MAALEFLVLSVPVRIGVEQLPLPRAQRILVSIPISRWALFVYLRQHPPLLFQAIIGSCLSALRTKTKRLDHCLYFSGIFPLFGPTNGMLHELPLEKRP